MDKNVFLGVLLYGSLWGCSEASLGAVLHYMHYPFKGPVLMAVGVFLLAAMIININIDKTLTCCLLMGVVAALLKGFDVFFVGFDVMVYRPMISIMLEALAFGLAYRFITSASLKEKIRYPVAGASYAYLSYIGFALVLGVGGYGSRYWLNKSLADYASIIALDGSLTALLSVFAASAGYMVGVWLNDYSDKRLHKPFAYVVILLCWFIGVLYS